MKSEPEPVTARHLMQTNVVCLRRRKTLLSAIVQTLRHDLRHIPILDKSEHVVGIVSLGDLRDAVGELRAAVAKRRQRRRLKRVRLAEMMSPSPVVVSPEARVGEMAEMLVARGVGALLVVNPDGKLLGMVSDLDLLEQLSTAPGRGPRARHQAATGTSRPPSNHEPSPLPAT